MTEMSKGGNIAPASPALDRRESLTDSSLRREVDELKTQLKEIEKRSEREIKALNQEVRSVVLPLRPFAC
jgi:CAP-Gly domain-containing linker protein 1